jgi:hypothetical protein
MLSYVTIVIIANFMSLSPLRMPKSAGSAQCGAITTGQGQRHHY